MGVLGFLFVFVVFFYVGGGVCLGFFMCLFVLFFPLTAHNVKLES